jgi:hypothetical protein
MYTHVMVTRAQQIVSTRIPSRHSKSLSSGFLHLGLFSEKMLLLTEKQLVRSLKKVFVEAENSKAQAGFDKGTWERSSQVDNFVSAESI